MTRLGKPFKPHPTVGFHNIEVDNSQLTLAQAYISKTSEFKDRMDKLQLRLVGLNEAYSLLDPNKYCDISKENRLIGKFMREVGGIYTGPHGPLTDDEELMRKIAQICNDEGKRLSETNGIKFAYHTHSSLGFRRLMDLTDHRYVNLTRISAGWRVGIVLGERNRLRPTPLKYAVPTCHDSARYI